MQNELRRTFASLAVPNYRLYFIGQGISLCGTWMQMIGLSWLVLKLTHSGTQLGLITAAQFLPILFFGMVGGPIVGVTSDHSSPRIGLAVGGAAAILAAGMGILAMKSPRKVYSGEQTGNSAENLV